MERDSKVRDNLEIESRERERESVCERERASRGREGV